MCAPAPPRIALSIRQGGRMGDAFKGATCTWVLVAPFSRMCSVLRPGIEKDYYGRDSASVSIVSPLSHPRWTSDVDPPHRVRVVIIVPGNHIDAVCCARSVRRGY